MMKKVLFALSLTACGSLTVSAQEGLKLGKPDALKPRWSLDINLKGGNLAQQLTMVPVASYTDNVNTRIADPKFSDGRALGFDVQLGYFPGKKHHLGIGAGFQYFAQTGVITMDYFHTEYRSVDRIHGDVFRQVLTANGPIREELSMTSINIPLMLKYKDQFSKRFGITLEAGGLYSLKMRNKYTTDANFDYGAIYRYNGDGGAVYDNSVTPVSPSLLITEGGFKSGGSYLTAIDYINAHYDQGYNVKLDHPVDQSSGTSSYMTGAIGFMAQAGFSYQISYRMALNLGGYYISQAFKNTDNEQYRMTDKVGEYHDISTGVATNKTSAYGVSLGVRFYIGKGKDSDGDKIPDAKDNCPFMAGQAQYKGCPDTDGDGILDKDDDCPSIPGPAFSLGCPDSDGDGIVDKDDQCPELPGTRKTQGCPDKDGDGIADDFDKCPDVPGTRQFEGCPSKEDRNQNLAQSLTNEGVTIPRKEEPMDTATVTQRQTNILLPGNNVVLSVNVIQFVFGSAEIKQSSYTELNDAVEVLTKNPNLVLAIYGYTDNIGGDDVNLPLSLARAAAVKRYIMKHGIDVDRLIISGYGSSKPVAGNKTPTDRAKNRRVVMRLLQPLQ